MSLRASDAASSDSAPRRGFLARTAASLLAALCAGVPAGLSLGFLLHPLRGKSRRAGAEADQGGAADDEAAAAGFVPLPFGPAALAADGTPQRVTVTADRADAWNFHAQQPVGSIWLRRLPDGGLLAWSTVCPHLGCSVEHRAAQGDFFCPCHSSAFDLQGRRKNAVPPRDMDLLDTRVEAGRIWVRFQNFRRGVPEKVVV